MRTTRLFYGIFTAIITAALIVSCSGITGDFNNTYAPSQQSLAEVLFRVKVREPLPDGSTLMLEILDDVTGLYFNSSRYVLSTNDALNYSINVPLPVTSDIKYRYVMSSTGSSYEYNSQNQQVRFRIARINGPEIIEDHIAAWANAAYSGPVGRISGQVIDADSKAPIPNLLITVGGMQTFTSSDGSFILTGVAAGLHNLVIYSIDGAYETFQQGALIAENANTPVQVALTKRKITRVTFDVKLPFGVDRTLPLRLISNQFPLGNAYADLAAGSAGNAINYPVMTRIAANRYSITLDLPVGAHLRYKYSFGDGFWNAELNRAGEFVVRDLVVNDNLKIKDRVITFIAKGSEPVHLLVQAPVDTPSQETVFVQLNPFGWTEPLPMISAGINLWKFTIYSPLHYFDSVAYRYCRNGLCDVAPERSDLSRIIKPGTGSQTLSDVIFAWENLDQYSIDTTQFLSLEPIQPRPGFIAGIELSPEKPVTWRNSIDEGLQYAAGIGGDWVILTPTWTFKETNHLPEISPSPAHDPLWTELMNQNSHVMMSGQKTILFPMLYYTQSLDNLALSSTNEEWKTTFFEQYERFIYHNADLAQLLGIEGFVLATPPLAPGSDNEVFNLMIDPTQWAQLITGIRQRYTGRVIAAVRPGSAQLSAPDWLSQVDIIYFMYSPPVFTSERSVSEIRQFIDTALLDQMHPVYEQFAKPVILGFHYDSINEKGDIDLASQAKAYSAAILSVASQDWISGFISRGYYPYVELQDTTGSIYRKPASEILWFWFHFLLNKTPNK